MEHQSNGWVVTVLGSDMPYSVYQRAGSANWWLRFSLPKQGQIRIALKPDLLGQLGTCLSIVWSNHPIVRW